MTYPEVEKYATAVAAAEIAQREAHRKARDAYTAEAYPFGGRVDEDVRRAAYARQQEEQLAASRAHRVARNTAWNTLREESADPLVHFIVEHCKEYQGQALDVLRALPATYEELEELADEQEWCDIWDQFRDAAVEAGVLDGPRPIGKPRTDLIEWLKENSCCDLDRSQLRELHERLNGIVAAETAK